MQFTTSVVFALCTVASFFGDASAAPSFKLIKKDVFDPFILFPHQHDVFFAGQTITVQWDTSELPAGLNDEGLIVLARPVPGNENLDFDHVLADGFQLLDGQQDITFPVDLETASNYAICLFGDSGNLSGDFTIIASQ